MCQRWDKIESHPICKRRNGKIRIRMVFLLGGANLMSEAIYCDTMKFIANRLVVRAGISNFVYIFHYSHLTFFLLYLTVAN